MFLSARVTASDTRRNTLAVCAVLLGIFSYRVSERSVFAPFRNATKGIRPIAQQINTLVPEPNAIYTGEMFERWVAYYLKREGRTVRRIDERSLDALLAGDPSREVFVLLSFSEESWRLFQLGDATGKGVTSAGPEILADLQAGNDHLLLIKTTPAALPKFLPYATIPTVPSYPFYAEASVLD